MKKLQELKANPGTLLIPTGSTAKTAQRFIKHIRESGAQIDWIAKLEGIAEKNHIQLLTRRLL